MTNFGRGERAVARLLLVTFMSMMSFPASSVSAEQWEDPNNATFGDDVSLSNSVDGIKTEFTIDSNQTTINWQDLQQPETNTLIFTFTNANDRSTVLNYIGAQHPSQLNGTVECAGCTVAFANPYGIYIGGEAVLDVGNLALIAGDINQADFMSGGLLDADLSGGVANDGRIFADGNVVLMGREVINNGSIRLEDGALLMLAGEQVAGLDVDALTDVLVGDGANIVASLHGGFVSNSGVISARDAALMGSRVHNQGEITIADGTLLMVGAESISFARFDDPILIEIPRADTSGTTTEEGPVYAIENDGVIDAGLGHVRLSASDPLGFGIRQGTGGRISASSIQVEGGQSGRVELSGVLDASDDSEQGSGGRIDVTGDIIILSDAMLDASGTRGGGTIHVGGEQEGSGELQRARAVLVDSESEIHADALRSGDGGRVIVFSEKLTSIDGALSARGGAKNGNGGFIETSGLAQFAISRTPDVSAPNGRAGDWLIDPYDICISSNTMGCGYIDPETMLPGEIPNTLDDAINAILDPDFDDFIFDGIIRTLGTSVVDPAIIAKALAVGTNVALSTQAFADSSEPDGNGDITLEETIQILNADTLPSTEATFTLLAAGNINIDADILSGTTGENPNLKLNVVLRANDQSQDDLTQDFNFDRVRGDVVINGDIETGGGNLSVNGISIHQDVASTILTLGGNVNFSSGTVNDFGTPVTLRGDSEFDIASDDPQPIATFIPVPNLTGYAPIAISIDGTIDTSDGVGDGGNINLRASSVNVEFRNEHDVVTAELDISDTATLTSGGGNITLVGGGLATSNSGVGFAANVHVDGILNSCADVGCLSNEIGGNITITATHIDPTGGSNQDVTFVEPDTTTNRQEGGMISIDVGTNGIRTGGGMLSIGSATTRQISIDGDLSTLNASDIDERGLISILALDENAIDLDEELFGDGQIWIGTQSATSLLSAGIQIEGRGITTSDGIAGNSVDIQAAGSSSLILANVAADELLIVGNRNIDFGIDTNLSAESVTIEAATRPTELTQDERVAGDPALVFRGGNGAGETGVLISATNVSITTGDGTTATPNLFEDELVDEFGVPTDFALSRSAYGVYDGLRLQSFILAAIRPDEIVISQDAAFMISDAANVGDSELNLAAAFDGSVIGAEGMLITLESSDGILTVADATGLNNNAITQPDSDAGKSWVTLLGGLLLPVPPVPIPSPETVPTENSVVFGDDGGMTPLATPFNTEGLIISTPGDMTINSQVAMSIGSVNELFFEAGRNTGIDDAAGRGTITIADDTSDILLSAGESLSILAGGSGFGDLIFEATPTESITLSANDILLRAGAGSSSLNNNADDRSAIQGLASNQIDIRDAAGNVFGSDASPLEIAFRYRQDAGIDTEVDLPSLDQFGLVPADGFRDARDVIYSVQSDQGIIELDDGIIGTNEGDRFRDAALRLIGTQPESGPAINVSDEFSFQGDSVEIGATNNFRYTEIFANAFNRSNLNSAAEMTLRAGVGGSGHLSFDADTQVIAARINLISGDGIGGDAAGTISTKNATFDMSGANAGSKIFVFQQDHINHSTQGILSVDQFVGGVSGAPDTLVIRSDSGRLTFTNFDFTELPIDTTGSISRLVLEADTIELTQSDGNDPNLDLRSLGGLNLRLRTNHLELNATTGSDDELGGMVLMNSSDPGVSIGNDADFNNAELLIEAFDLESDDATVENLSSLSADLEGAFDFDLDDGRSPTSIAIEQNGSLASSDLASVAAFSGRLARTLDDDENDNDAAIATNYSIISRFSPVVVSPDKVNGSRLVLQGESGSNFGADGSAIRFEAGDYFLSRLAATTPDSITVSENTTFTVETQLLFLAGVDELPDNAVTEPYGSIRFESDGTTPTIDLTANQISLIAGPSFTLTEPDGPDDDDDRDPVDNDLLPTIETDGIRQIRRSGESDGSFFSLLQNADLDTTTDLDMNGASDLVEALLGGPQWESVELTSIQGELNVSSIDDWVQIAENFTLETGFAGTIIADLEGHLIQFGDFLGDVLISSNDITFKTEDEAALKQLDLASPNIEIRTTAAEADRTLVPAEERHLIRDDPDALERAIVRFRQVADFDDTAELPLPEQYTISRSILNIDGSVTTSLNRRANLSLLDIELQTTGTDVTLTLDNAIRDVTLGSNLILKSAGDIAIDLTGASAGFGKIDAAALQLSSLDIRTNFGVSGEPLGDNEGEGNIRFTIAGFPTAEQTDPDTGFDPPPTMIQTTGDQRFDGNLELDSTLTNRGRDITIIGDVFTTTAAGLTLQTSGLINLQGNIGTEPEPLSTLTVLFEDDSTTPPSLEFGRRLDLDGDGIAETPDPINPNQAVYVDNDIIFEADNATDTTRGNRKNSAPYATVGKALGDLFISSLAGDIIMGTGEKLSVGGTATLQARGGSVRLSDVAALDLAVETNRVELARRGTGTYFDRNGKTQSDGGPSIVANTISFQDIFGSDIPVTFVGSGKATIFGLPDPFSPSTYPSFLNQFSLFEIRSSGRSLTTNDFRFRNPGQNLDGHTPILTPTGSSRSDLSGAFGPENVPEPTHRVPQPFLIPHPERLGELGVEPRIATSEVQVARLRGGAVIDDTSLVSTAGFVTVTQSRLDAVDVEDAIEVYQGLFGPGGNRAPEVRSILQDALDRYLEETRARHVIGFELRRYVKNRPSTLIKAYETLESLDELFRYHRRLGLSPGEFRKIQREWLREIQPEGITLDELSETIHPSRYVRGSDILDIFGQ